MNANESQRLSVYKTNLLHRYKRQSLKHATDYYVALVRSQPVVKDAVLIDIPEELATACTAALNLKLGQEEINVKLDLARAARMKAEAAADKTAKLEPYAAGLSAAREFGTAIEYLAKLDPTVRVELATKEEKQAAVALRNSCVGSTVACEMLDIKPHKLRQLGDELPHLFTKKNTYGKMCKYWDPKIIEKYLADHRK